MNASLPTHHAFVSRGGIKIQAAIKNWKLDVKNLVVLDVGSSTGGFVDCLLQNGAQKVYALDTAYGELAWKLRKDPRVVVMERTNILHLKNLPSPVISNAPTRHPERLSEGSQDLKNQSRDSSSAIRNDNKVDLITIDCGWTRLELILPIVKNFLKPDGKIIALLKPHYEAEKHLLKKGILPEELAEVIKEEVSKKILNSGFLILNSMDSPILGGAGNKEFLLLLMQK